MIKSSAIAKNALTRRSLQLVVYAVKWYIAVANAELMIKVSIIKPAIKHSTARTTKSINKRQQKTFPLPELKI